VVRVLCVFFLAAAISGAGKAEGQTPAWSQQCDRYANKSRHACLEKQLAVSTAELEAATSAVRKMMAQWEHGRTRQVAEANFEATVGAFERYRRTQCEYFASMRYGLGDEDEIGIARLECMLHMNAQRTALFTDLTKTIVM
jgi:hypothetical protein